MNSLKIKSLTVTLLLLMALSACSSSGPSESAAVAALNEIVQKETEGLIRVVDLDIKKVEASEGNDQAAVYGVYTMAPDQEKLEEIKVQAEEQARLFGIANPQVSNMIKSIESKTGLPQEITLYMRQDDDLNWKLTRYVEGNAL